MNIFCPKYEEKTQKISRFYLRISLKNLSESTVSSHILQSTVQMYNLPPSTYSKSLCFDFRSLVPCQNLRKKKKKKKKI